MMKRSTTKRRRPTKGQIRRRVQRMSRDELRMIEQKLQARAAAKARASLAEFVKQAWPVLEPGTPLKWNWHIDHICAHLEAVTDGRIRRLLINIPPGHMKSLIVSVFWPAWVWLQQPEWRMLCGSYAQDLSLRDANRCRDLIQSEWYQSTFGPPWTLDRKQNAKGHYRNTATGSRVAFSVGGRVTGLRANCIIIDDPLNAMDAYSDVKRPRANIWLDEAVTTRLSDPKKGAIVIIMQRLHHEDVSAHVLAQGGYEHLCLPSYFEPERAYSTSIGWSDPRREAGELLCPELVGEEQLKELEVRLGRLAFAGQYQQTPTPASGNLFKAEDLCQDAAGKDFWPYPNKKIVEAYFSWDTAVKANSYNDFTAGCLSLMTSDGYVYVFPVTLKRLESQDVVKEIALQWARWKERLGSALQWCYIEDGAGAAVIQYIRALMQEKRERTTPPHNWTPEDWDEVRRAPQIVVAEYSPQQDKVSRAHEVLPFVSSKRVRLVDTSLSREWLQQLLGFPLAAHDDAVDATVYAIRPRALMTAEQIRARQMIDKAIERGRQYDASYGIYDPDDPDDIDPDDPPDFEYRERMKKRP